MQERGRDQQVSILGRQDRGHAPRLVGDCLDMDPPVAQRSDQLFCLRCCPRLQGHGVTIPCALGPHPDGLVGCVDDARKKFLYILKADLRAAASGGRPRPAPGTAEDQGAG
jgi:hypothetical protein